MPAEPGLAAVELLSHDAIKMRERRERSEIDFITCYALTSERGKRSQSKREEDTY